MKHQFRVVHIYVDAETNLIIIPTGRSEKWKGAIMELDLPSQLNQPYTDEVLEKVLLDAMQQCFSIETNDNIKESALERFLKVKGYAKAVKGRKLIGFDWALKIGYQVIPTEKIPKRGMWINKRASYYLAKK